MSSVRLVVGFTAFLLTLLVVASGGWVTPARADIDHVTNCTDGDPGSLRAVVNAAANGDTVVFDVECTGAAQITLSTEILVIDKAVTIDGTGHQITISGGDTSRIFNAGHGGTITLNRLTLTHGAAGDGGAIAVTGSLTLTNVTISNSSASSSGGGAIGNFGGTLSVQRSTFIGNTAPKLGGAIWSNGSAATIETSTFTQNQSSNDAGGIGVTAGLLMVSRSTFAGNTAAGRGGAVRVDGASQFVLTNSTLTNNTSTAAGGAIFTENTTTSTLNNDTLVADNVSVGGTGAEITAQGPVTVANTIVSGNSGSNCTGAVNNDGNNLQFGDTTCGFSLTANPRLGPLRDNTGPTQTMALGEGSAAIDAANPFICRILGVDNIDQRGQSRTDVVRNTCDIGAYDTGGAVVGPASGSTTAITCAVCRFPVGGSTTITVQAKSASGRSLTVGGDTVTLATNHGTLSDVADKGNGMYTATLQSPTKPSKATVSGTINGQQITTTATVKFTPAAPSAAKTTISARRVNVPVARGKTRIVVDSQDRFGNDIPTGGAKVRLKSTAGKLRVVRDLHNGNYAATLSRNKEEDQKVLITGRINGKRIKDTAVVFFK